MLEKTIMTNKMYKLFFIIIVSLFLILFLLFVAAVYIEVYVNDEDIEYLNPVVNTEVFNIEDDCVYLEKGIYTCTDNTEIDKEGIEELFEEDIRKPNTPEKDNIIKFIGKVSYYSHDGCVGCHPEQIMANGEKFDENAMTLAFNKLPLNTKVNICNLDNNKCQNAKVTDTGGFESLGRIADLSKGLAEFLEVKTDVSTIQITKL